MKKNWVVYYCYRTDRSAPGCVPLRMQSVEMPNTGALTREGALKLWLFEYKPAYNELVCWDLEPCPDDYYDSAGKPAQAYYAERVSILTGLPLPVTGDAAPEIGFELHRAEHTGQKGYDGDDVMDAVRKACM